MKKLPPCECRLLLNERASEPTIITRKWCRSCESAWPMAEALRKIAMMRKGGQYTYDRDEAFNIAVNALHAAGFNADEKKSPVKGGGG